MRTRDFADFTPGQCGGKASDMKRKLPRPLELTISAVDWSSRVQFVWGILVSAAVGNTLTGLFTWVTAQQAAVWASTTSRPLTSLAVGTGLGIVGYAGLHAIGTHRLRRQLRTRESRVSSVSPSAEAISVADQVRLQELRVRVMEEKRLAKELAVKQAEESVPIATRLQDLHLISVWTEREDYSSDRVHIRLKNVSDSVLNQCLVKVENVESQDWIRSHGSTSPISRSLRTTGQELAAKWGRFKLAPDEWKDIAVGRIDRRNGVLILEYEGGTAYIDSTPSAAKIELGFYGGRTSRHATMEVARATGGFIISADGLSASVKYQPEESITR
jgi:hypothetical protein